MEIQDDERSTEGAKNSANSESLEDEETLIAPLVFQCGRCRCIVGDSFSFVCTDQSLGLVCLSAVTGVEPSQRAVLSTSGADDGCVYKDLVCTTCGDYKLGKLYTATPKQLVHMQQLYSLNTASITSFMLGSGELRVEDDDVMERLPSVQSLRSLRGEFNKLQVVLLGIDARLQEAEGALRELKELKALLRGGTKTEPNGITEHHANTAMGESSGAAKRKREANN